MSGVFGCWHLDARPIDVEVFRGCVGRISPAGTRDIQTWIHGSIGLGCKGGDALGASRSDRGGSSADPVPCVFDGRIDNRHELIRRLADDPRVAAHCDDRDLLLAAYDHFGDAFVQHVHGDFAVAVFDRRQQRLVLARDRLGLRPLCYTHSGGAFLFGTEAKALLAHPGMIAAPDELMLADSLLSFRALDSQTRTFFAGIRSLPAAHLLIATSDGVSVRRYFEFDTRQTRLRSFSDYAEAFGDLFDASVRKRLRCARPVAISVSGGLDSAYIFCVAQRALAEGTAQCPAVLGFNYAGAAGTPSEEERFVSALEQASGARITRLRQRAGFIECAAGEVWHAESPIVQGLACQGQAVLRRVRNAGAGRFITGHWGDQMLSDSDYLLDLFRSGRWRSLERHARAWRIGIRGVAARFVRDVASRRLPPSVASAARRARSRRGDVCQAPWFTPRFRRVLCERAASDGLAPLGRSSHARAIHQQSRLGYHVQCMEWNSRIGAMHALDVAFPYLDCDLIQFLMSIPGEVQSHGGVPRGLMRQAMRGVVPDAVIDRRSKGEFTHLMNEGIVNDFDAICDLLGPSALAVRFGYLDGAVLCRQLREWHQALRSSADAVLTNRIVHLCGFELLLRQFFSHSEVTIPGPAVVVSVN
jgi:asparagine synthase (glutamine-hydrolysing)